MKTITTILLFLFIGAGGMSCNLQGNGKDDGADTMGGTGYVDSMSMYNENLEDAETGSQVKHANGILSGNIEPGDDAMTIRCMDSVMSHNAATRQFYFRVLRVIANKADGALAEMVSAYLKTIFETYPADFLAFYKDPQTPKDVIDGFLSFEFEGLTDNELSTYFATLQNTCNGCIADDKKLIEAIKQRVSKKARYETETDRPEE